MFERQTRQSFPVMNIIVLAIVVVALLVYLLKSVQAGRSATPDLPVPASDSGYYEVRIDSLGQ